MWTKCRCEYSDIENDWCNSNRVKGRFGLAFVAETPCCCPDPTGWQVEFCDSPSKVEQRCLEMIEWASQPPIPRIVPCPPSEVISPHFPPKCNPFFPVTRPCSSRFNYKCPNCLTINESYSEEEYESSDFNCHYKNNKICRCRLENRCLRDGRKKYNSNKQKSNYMYDEIPVKESKKKSNYNYCSTSTQSTNSSSFTESYYEPQSNKRNSRKLNSNKKTRSNDQNTQTKTKRDNFTCLNQDYTINHQKDFSNLSKNQNSQTEGKKRNEVGNQSPPNISQNLDSEKNKHKNLYMVHIPPFNIPPFNIPNKRSCELIELSNKTSKFKYDSDKYEVSCEAIKNCINTGRVDQDIKHIEDNSQHEKDKEENISLVQNNIKNEHLNNSKTPKTSNVNIKNVIKSEILTNMMMQGDNQLTKSKNTDKDFSNSDLFTYFRGKNNESLTSMDGILSEFINYDKVSLPLTVENENSIRRGKKIKSETFKSNKARTPRRRRIERSFEIEDVGDSDVKRIRWPLHFFRNISKRLGDMFKNCESDTDNQSSSEPFIYIDGVPFSLPPNPPTFD